MTFWQHLPERLPSSIFQIGSFELRVYGLMVALAFLTVYFLVLYRVKLKETSFSQEAVQSMFFWAVLGVIIGARLGYVLIYDLTYYRAHPLEILLPFARTPAGGFQYTGIAGMSYHGGLIGLVIVSLLYCQKKGTDFWKLTDLFVPTIPLGYTFGRLGNFFNGELYGRPTSLPWGMYFPSDPLAQLRHPSQLYEGFFEGIFLFVILWALRNKKVFEGFTLCLYLTGYGMVRFLIEFVREPDSQLGFIWGPLTMGQILCLGMILAGAVLFGVKRKKPHENPPD